MPLFDVILGTLSSMADQDAGLRLIHALIWALELQYVQACTTRSRARSTPRFERFAPWFRLISNYFFCLAWSFLSPSWLLVIVDFLAAMALYGLMLYGEFFLRPLSLITIIRNWREGLPFVTYSRDWWHRRYNVVPVGTLVAKLAALWYLRDVIEDIPTLLAGVGALFTYVIVQLIAMFIDPLFSSRVLRSMDRMIAIRGYLLPWIAEWLCFDRQKLLDLAHERAESYSDQLTPQETSIAVRRKIIIIQVETLDINCLGLTVTGCPVTPVLTALKSRGLFYAVQSPQAVGSADADFSLLSGGRPAEYVVNYSLPRFQYRRSLPQLLQQVGYRSVALHGNYGTFYQRRAAFERMGFSQICFREELEQAGNQPLDFLGVQDHGVLAWSAGQLNAATDPVCHFIITLTSHTPFRGIPAGTNSIFCDPQTLVERYLNHIQYVDRCLGQYLESLRDPYTLVIYSDHPARHGDANFTPAPQQGRNVVPFLIVDSEEDLSARQQTSGEIATAGSLTFLDAVWYLRRQIEQVVSEVATGNRSP